MSNNKRLTQIPRIDLDVSLRLTYDEAKALDALAGYGIKPFLEVFYKHMGRHYLEPHEAGLRSLFETIRANLPAVTTRYENAQRAFALANPVIRSRQEHDELIERLQRQAVERAAHDTTKGGASHG